jgi:hypothetical protein
MLKRMQDKTKTILKEKDVKPRMVAPVISVEEFGGEEGVEMVGANPTKPALDPSPPAKPMPPFVANLPKRRGGKKLFIIGIIVCLLVVSTISIILVLKAKPKSAGEMKGEAQVEETIPKITPSPNLNKEEWDFEVLNGSGVSGVAKKVAKKLEEMGYKVVSVGNADNYDYKEDELFVSKQFEAKVNLLLADLEAEFKISSSSGELENSTASARLIIGKKTAEGFSE